MESSLDYYQQNQENKWARHELFSFDPSGCYNHIDNNIDCIGCGEPFEPAYKDQDHCQYCIDWAKTYMNDYEN